MYRLKDLGIGADMLTPEDIVSQQELLEAHRRTLQIYLLQQANLGTAFMPPGILNGIFDARNNIRYIKKYLADNGVPVSDNLYDEPHDGEYQPNKSANNINDLTGLFVNYSRITPNVNKDYFDQFIDPVWKYFSNIYENYKVTFQQYIQLIKSGVDIKDIVDQITQDSVCTSDLRAVVKTMLSNLPTAQSDALNAKAMDFIHSISNYFDNFGDVQNVVDQDKRELASLFTSNIMRLEVTLYLLDMQGDFDRQKATMFFLAKLNSIQSSFGIAADSYQKIRIVLCN